MATSLTLTTAGRNYWMQRHNLGNAVTLDKVTFGQGTTTNPLGRTSLVTPFNPAVELGLNTSSCLLYTSPSPRDRQKSRMPSSA